ncbi:MAG: DUF6497 family protein [Gemmobacter sp.]
MRAAVLLALMPASAVAEVVPVPSGQVVTLQDVIWNEPGDAGLTMRFRFVAPAIARNGGTVSFETAEGDMQFLCDTYALPRARTVTGPEPAQIVISLSDVPVAFGEAAPEATQFFEAYTPDGDTCRWEPF